MKTFLEFVAEDILQKYGTDLSRIAVVFPNKRASLFLNEHLARKANKPIWSPSYITISDLFRQHSSKTIGDPIKLTCDIYKSFIECTGINETLDHFYGWGQLLLSDFDDIDKNMADASRVFANLKDIHELDDISYLTDEQKEMLQKFFSNFSDDHNSELKRRFLQLWCHFEDIYNNFKNRLNEQNIAYEGMLYREVATDETVEFGYDKYLFVGFNVIQKAEQVLFSRLKDEGKAHFYWDFDKYYMKASNGMFATNEAGHYISQYLKYFPNELDIDISEIYDNFSKDKNVTYISAPTENIQARYVTNWLTENNRYTEGKKNAIVLCDESLLQTIIHYIPDEVEKVNITTGYPLVNTPIASLTMQLLALQTIGFSPSKGRFRLKYVIQVLSHPYIHYISDKYSELANDLKEKRAYYPTSERLSVDDNLKTLFRASNGNSEIIQWILDVLRLIASGNKENDPLFQESIFRMYTLINRIGELIKSGDLDVDTITMQKLISQLIASTSIPFHGEPAEGIQIMGVLETRNLDFDNVLILSCNEGNMPKGVNDSSFIPYSIRKAYGLTTIDNKVAIYAYYFYRLIQRASNITIAYNNSTDNGHTGEMSRFMLQLMVESNFNVNQKYLRTGQNQIFNEPETIEKNEHVMNVLNDISYLSPTAINRYMRCPLQFYYYTIAGLKEPDDLGDDEIDNRMFGNIFHKAAEIIYTNILKTGVIITSEQINNVLKHRETIERVVDQAFGVEVFNRKPDSIDKIEYNGLQLINREVIIRYIIRLLEIDRSLAPFKIKELESAVYDDVTINTSDGEKTISIGGRIDRIDQVVDRESNMEKIRIVDYKTGGSHYKGKINSVEEIFQMPIEPHKHADYHLQTMLYSMIVRNKNEYNPQQLPVSPALLFIQHTQEEDYEPIIKIGKDKVTDIEIYKEEFHERLVSLLGEIFEPQSPFYPTDNQDICSLCPYSRLCGIK
ncbi:MAG: PD-(D/E)XK nuclease family protein [Prevotellaceae bacterium]|nr:PD-(D/E)XK nuclease family protein [Prevotellaceae bacterium]